MPVKDEFMKYTGEFPFIEGYLFQQFIFTQNPDEDFFKYTVFYAKNNITSFLLTTEVGKKADFTGLKSELILGKEIHFGYTTSHKGLAGLKAKKTASWKQEDRALTITQIGEEELEHIIPKVLESESVSSRPNFTKELSALFSRSRWLPEIYGWTLLTLVFWKTNAMDADGQHQILHAQANYLKEGDFLNVELRFGCSHPIALKAIKLETELEDEQLGAFRIKRGDIKGETFLYYENEEFRFSVISHDNLQNKAKHPKELEQLLLAAIYSLEGI